MTIPEDGLSKETLAELARILNERAEESSRSFKTLEEQLRKFKKKHPKGVVKKKRGNKFTKNKKSKRNGKNSSRKEKK